ncbi:MAG TPA: prenyltransferase/squalene oxidase repeat-containing protein [Gemmataceae bacterium]|nr:prenyltransferase/squalene oxidase repeat-containing protein [Gemmataceae bacterium]
MSSNQSVNARAVVPPVIRPTPLSEGGETISWMRIIPIWIFSAVLHAIMVFLFLAVTGFLSVLGEPASAGASEPVAINTLVEEPVKEVDLTNPDIGIDPEVPLNYDTSRIDKVSIPGEINPTQAVGIADAAAGPALNIPPPPGSGFGQGGGLPQEVFGKAPAIGLVGGAGGFKYVPGGFGGRSGATREQMALQGGGNKESEAAVALALEWLALHQSNDGRWSLDNFHHHAHDKLGPGARQFTCNCTGQGQKNDIAATAFGLLPFLAAGQTHRPSGGKDGQRDYSKNVENGLKYLMSKQGRDGDFGGGMYAHGLATIAMCEAFGMTSDPTVKHSAQRALDFVIYAQHEPSGGWRYAPKQSGDTSVVGWQVMALKSGQMAGLSVPTPTLRGADKWLDSVMDKKTFGYSYLVGRPPTPTMTAVGLLCRQYLGWSPRKQELIKGVETLTNNPPGKLNNMYYYYYATQVMHHLGGEPWEAWNLGTGGKPGMRDWLIARQDKGTDPKHPHHRGSWSPAGDAHGSQGGRLMITSLAVLTLEVYYRHLPLYRRDLGGNKEMNE